MGSGRVLPADSAADSQKNIASALKICPPKIVSLQSIKYKRKCFLSFC